MRLLAPTAPHLAEMMAWISGPEELASWAGPGFRYPFTLQSFTEDLRIDELDSFFLVQNELDIRAFGQCYVRLSRCHLGRLIVAPQFRGQRIADMLIQQLCDFGEQHFDSQGFSLFVLENNEPAIRSYQRIGFQVSTYPEKNPLEHCLYMIKE